MARNLAGAATRDGIADMDVRRGFRLVRLGRQLARESSIRPETAEQAMNDPLADTLKMIDNWERNATEKAAKFQAMSDRVAEVSITESVAGGAVSATVGNNGLPTDIAMTDRVRDMSPDEIAANVMAAIRKAQARYPQALAEIMAETVGDDPAGQHIIATAEQNFPAEEEEETSAPEGTEITIGDVEDDSPIDTTPRQSRQSSGTDDDDDGDFSDESFLR